MTGDELRDYYAKAGVCVDVNPDATDEDADEWARMVAECLERDQQKKERPVPVTGRHEPQSHEDLQK